MARIGYRYNAGTPGNGQAQAFRNFLAANLTTWTVGPVYVFGSGANERDYFTLTSSFGGEEILVTMPNGASADMTNSLDDSLIFSGDQSIATDQTIGFMLAVDGGFESRFLAGDDPNTDTGTFYPNRVTRVTPLEFWNEGTQPNVFYIIEDDANAAFYIYVGLVTNNSGYSYWGYSSDYNVFDRVPNDPTFNWNGNSVVQISVTQSTANTPRPTSSQRQWFHYTGQTERFIDISNATSVDWSTPGFISDNLTDNNQPNPETGTFISARTETTYIGNADIDQEVTSLGFIGQLNPGIHRQFGNIVGAYRRKLTAPTGEVFVHLYFGQLTPWAGNLLNPV